MILNPHIAKMFAKNLEKSTPVGNDKPVFTQKEIDHFYKCKKQDCEKCKELAKR